MKEVRLFLKMEYQEDGKLIWISIETVLLMLAFFLKEVPNYGLAILIGGMYLGAYIVSSFHNRTGAEALLLGNGCYQKKKGTLLVISCYFHNLFLEVGIFLYLIILFKLNFIVIFYGLVLCLFTNAVGMLVGSMVKNEVAGMGVCILISCLNFMKLLMQEEYLRFFSPIVQIGNMKILQWWNLFVLLTLALTISIFRIVPVKRFALPGITVIFFVVAVDIQFHTEIGSVPEEYETYAGDILNKINEMNVQCGLMEYDNIVIYKSVYYPWKSNRDKMVFYEKDGTLYMNCFTEYLCNLDEEEIVVRWGAAAMKPKTRLQMAIMDLYTEYFLGNIEYVAQFTSEQQMEAYGTIPSKNYGLAAEVLLNQKESYGELYRLSKEYEDDEKVLEIWKERSGNL